MSTSDEERKDEVVSNQLEAEACPGKRKEPPDAEDEDQAQSDDSDDNVQNIIDQTRMERKRQREKKRRTDVNKGLEQLMNVIFMIDPELKAEADERHKRSHRAQTEPESMISRVELINSAIATLLRIHQENEERKMVVSQLSKGLLAAAMGQGDNARSATLIAPLGGRSLPPAFIPNRFAAAPSPPLHVAQAIQKSFGFHQAQGQKFDAATLASLQQAIQNDPRLSEALGRRLGGHGGPPTPAPVSRPSTSLPSSFGRGADFGRDSLPTTRPSLSPETMSLLRGLERDGLGYNNSEYCRALLHHQRQGGSSIPGAAELAASLAGSVAPTTFLGGAHLAELLSRSAPPAPVSGPFEANILAMLQVASREQAHQAMQRGSGNETKNSGQGPIGANMKFFGGSGRM